MNRQEAIDRLNKEVKRIEEIMENGDYGCVDIDTWNEFEKKAEWRKALIALLSSPVTDPDTGLVPCGCGGKADCNDTGITSKDGKPLWWVECPECGISTYGHQQKDEAKAAWSRAMSGGLS